MIKTTQIENCRKGKERSLKLVEIYQKQKEN